MSLHSVIEQLTISGELSAPAIVIPFPLEIVTLWARTDFDVASLGRARLTFLSPSETPVIPPFEHDVDLRTYLRMRSRRHFQGLPVTEPGRHTFRVELQQEGETTWRQVAAIPLLIAFEPPENEGTRG